MSDESEAKERIARMKLIAEQWRKKKISVYIKDDLANQIYFGKIIEFGDKTIIIKCFAPPNKAGKIFVLYWEQIGKLEEFQEGGHR